MQDFAKAVRTYEHMVNIYTEYGYTLIDVPYASAKERSHFIVNTLAM